MLFYFLWYFTCIHTYVQLKVALRSLKVDESLYNGHSFCIGAATTAPSRACKTPLFRPSAGGGVRRIRYILNFPENSLPQSLGLWLGDIEINVVVHLSVVICVLFVFFPRWRYEEGFRRGMMHGTSWCTSFYG